PGEGGGIRISNLSLVCLEDSDVSVSDVNGEGRGGIWADHMVDPANVLTAALFWCREIAHDFSGLRPTGQAKRGIAWNRCPRSSADDIRLHRKRRRFPPIVDQRQRSGLNIGMHVAKTVVQKHPASPEMDLRLFTAHSFNQ